MNIIYPNAKEGIIDCSICGVSIDLIEETPDYFMGQPAHLDCASQLREDLRTPPVLKLIPKDIDDIIA
jgi:hypothetical protein